MIKGNEIIKRLGCERFLQSGRKARGFMNPVKILHSRVVLIMFPLTDG